MQNTHANNSVRDRVDEAFRMTAPGSPLRHALDMIIAGHMGALSCVGDEEKVLASGKILILPMPIPCPTVGATPWLPTCTT